MSLWAKDYSDITPRYPYLYDTAILVQAWKKAHAYIRQHNWYADSLELDISSIRLSDLIKEWANQLRGNAYKNYSPHLMRLVPAPKSDSWTIEDGWNPIKDDEELRLRPLAGISIRDQTIAMAFLICFANSVETAQGDPSTIISLQNRKSVVSYGHRLVSRWNDGKALFRWGSLKLYRQYYSDYQAFIKRPEKVRDMLLPTKNRLAIVHADLSQFYDRIKRDVLLSKLIELSNDFSPDIAITTNFKNLFLKLMSWSWHQDDVDLASHRCESTSPICLPQGLAASGFFANAYMIDFDQKIISSFDSPIENREWEIVDYCRYVDDMRFVIDLKDCTEDSIKSQLEEFLEDTLKQTAPGLKLNTDKTEVKLSSSRDSRAPIADTMQAVQNEVSGPMDIETGRQALQLLDGLLAQSENHSENPIANNTGIDNSLNQLFSTEPDVRNDTLERFVAHRWRTTYRALRLMSDADGLTDTSLNMGRDLLDLRAEEFANKIMRRWIEDPSNVRLLRVSMDIFPSPEYLKIVLDLLSIHLNRSTDTSARSVCHYVAAELLRAAATETGFVRDNDELPSKSNIEEYRSILADFAKKRIESIHREPWYLTQQALLYLAVCRIPIEIHDELEDLSVRSPLNRYILLHQLFSDNWSQNEFKNPIEEISPLILVLHRISGHTDICANQIVSLMDNANSYDRKNLLISILKEDEKLLISVWNHLSESEADYWRDYFRTAGYIPSGIAEDIDKTKQAHRLVDLISSDHNPFQNETASLRLMRSLVGMWGTPANRNEYGDGTLTPARIEISCSSWSKLADPTETLHEDDFIVRIQVSSDVFDERYEVPNWCNKSHKWKIEVAQIIRSSILGAVDYSQMYYVPKIVNGIIRYQGFRSNSYVRKHGLYNERIALGDRFLPISPWMTELLWKLLSWPGTDVPEDHRVVSGTIKRSELLQVIDNRLETLATDYGSSLKIPIYRYPVNLGITQNSSSQLKVALVQSILPKENDFSAADIGLNNRVYRRKHRRHISSMLQSVRKTLQIREGYKEKKEKVDLVIFPELAIHINDIYLMQRFVDKERCIVFCGVVFQPISSDQTKLVNSGLWILPVQSSEGRSIKCIQQGKFNLTAAEVSLGISPHRPCQWIIEGISENERLWRISGAICYDATDLRLAAELRNRSDAFIIPALNKDVNTFDNMVAALHYHMYQHVIVVNTGEYGGSTAQAPYKQPFRKLIVHHHGKDCPLVSVIKVDLNRFRTREEGPVTENDNHGDDERRKYPPAGFEGRGD